MWFLGTQLAKPAVELPVAMRLRGQAYWEQRLAAATASLDPHAYQLELGLIDLWCFYGFLDELWLAKQILSMFTISLVPDNGHHTVEWLAGLSDRYPDLAVEILLGFVQQAHQHGWLFTSAKTSVRLILSNGLVTSNPKTADDVSRIANHLASLGNATFLDLDRPILFQ